MAYEPSFGKWIPAYFIKPEYETNVLISTEHNHCEDGSGDFKTVEMGYFFLSDDGDENWYTCDSWRGNDEDMMLENVTAWMPLPKPFADKNLEDLGISESEED